MWTSFMQTICKIAKTQFYIFFVSKSSSQYKGFKANLRQYFVPTISSNTNFTRNLFSIINLLDRSRTPLKARVAVKVGHQIHIKALLMNHLLGQ